MRPLIDDPAWVRERYEEAKEIIADLREEATLISALDPDLSARIEDFYTETFLDRCTTLGPDCGCNTNPVALLERVCPTCGGSGRPPAGYICRDCQGSGKAALLEQSSSSGEA